jgi:hypothetical protein
MPDSPHETTSRPETRRDAKEKRKEPPEFKRFKKLLREVIRAPPPKKKAT